MDNTTNGCMKCESCDARIMARGMLLCPDCGHDHRRVADTLPAPAPWYAAGTTVDFVSSEIYIFGRVLESIDAFESVDDVFYYFSKPWKFDSEHARWVELGRPQLGIDTDCSLSEYVLDADTKATNFEKWKAGGVVA